MMGGHKQCKHGRKVHAREGMDSGARAGRQKRKARTWLGREEAGDEGEG